MKLAVGSDHAGLVLKEHISTMLREMGHEVKDFGTYSSDIVDYPDYAVPVAKAVAAGEYEKGILICGTGIGMSIAANKVYGIRAALCNSIFASIAAREHNNANILAIGERIVGIELALEIVKGWLQHEYLEGKHSVRLQKIADIS